MNERIKTLALSMINVYSIEYENGTKGIEFTEEAFERFAELIVRECAELMYGRDENGNCKDGDVIKKHFGVEE